MSDKINMYSRRYGYVIINPELHCFKHEAKKPSKIKQSVKVISSYVKCILKRNGWYE